MTHEKRVIVLVIDGLGIGLDNDSLPNTLRSLTAYDNSKTKQSGTYTDLCHFVNGEKSQVTSSIVTPSYEGADSYKGHYEMIGIDVGKNNIFIEEQLDNLAKIYSQLDEISSGIYIAQGKYYISNNIESELGTSINLIGDLDISSKEELIAEGRKLSKLLSCQRVIVMGNHDVPKERILRGVRGSLDSSTTTRYGIIPALCDLYDDRYFTYHVGRSLDSYNKPFNLIDSVLKRSSNITLIGKVGDILQVEHEATTSIPCVASTDTHKHVRQALKTDARLIFGNFQQVDLMCHACRPEEGLVNLLEVCTYIDAIRSELRPEDLLLVTADHGNDPGNDNNAHTRERVPLLAYGSNDSVTIDKSYDSLACIFNLANLHLSAD